MADLHPDLHADLAGFLLGALDQVEVDAFAQHLIGCVDCQGELAQLAHLPGLLVDVVPADQVPPGLEERTFAVIEAAARQPATATAASWSSGEPSTGSSGQVVPLRPGRRPGRAIRPAWLSVAAAVIVIAAGVGGLLATRGRRASVPLATIQLTAGNGGHARGVATVRAVEGGLTIDMAVDGLPVSPPGTMYTCWLVADGDTLAHPNRVSVGSFTVRAPGRIHVQWTTAADLHRFPHLGVTIEPDNGNPSHQGPKVLTGV
jgi:Anti-sigma-K factor rskA